MDRLKSLAELPAEHLREMTERECEDFIAVATADLVGPDQRPADFLAFVQGDPLLSIFGKRLAAYDPELPVRIPLCLLAGSYAANPAQAVQWAFYVVRRTRQLGRAVTVLDFSVTDFPAGVPTDEGCSVLWRAQKRAEDGPLGDNRMNDFREWGA